VPARFKDLCLDASDHQMLAMWWCRALGYEVWQSSSGTSSQPEDPIAIHDPTGTGPMIWINPVPERKVVKNRMHMDLDGDVDELLGQGATLVRARGGDIDWTILADPEGNEFCVFAPRA
jgi:hypothetical protein